MTAATHDELLDARERAIRESGWGEWFRLYQPRNLAFWLYAFLVGFGGLVVVQQWVPATRAYPGAVAFVVIAYALYAVPFWLFIRSWDRFGAVSGRLAVAAFVFGGFAATGALALHLNNAARSLWGKLNGAAFAADWSAALSAPLSEEVAKACGVILLLAMAPRLINSPFDGLVLGGFVGLGFQIVENVSYGVIGAGSGFGADPVGSAQTTVLFRMLVGIASHWVYSAIFVAGLITLIGRPDFPAQPARGVALMVIALLCHTVWDGASAIGAGSALAGFGLQLAVVVVVLGVFRAVYRHTARTEREWLRDVLAPEVAAGVLTEPEVRALAGDRKARRRFVHALARPDRATAKHVLAAAADLATQLARDHGRETNDVAYIRGEITRLRGGAPS